MLTRMRALRFFFACALVLVGCSGDDAAPPSDGGGGSAGAAPVLDPSLFDCTASAPPERTNTVPIACEVDPMCTTPLVSGHRSVGGDLGVIAPENTLSAVRAGIALGIDFVETDPRETKDGRLVNFHDPSVERTTTGQGDVDAMTLAEVQALTLETSRFAGDFSCDRVPTIEQVLLEARGKVHVLLDANKTSRVDLLVDAIHTTDTLEWAIFDTSSTEKIDEALALEPNLMIMIRVADLSELNEKLAHHAPRKPVIVELHDGASPDALVPTLEAAGLRGLLDAFGIDLVAGLGDDPSLYAVDFDAGIRIVQTDRPDLVLRYLGRR